MAKRVAGDGRVPWVVEEVARGVVAAPVTAGLIVLGAGVMLGRALLDVSHAVWPWAPSLEPSPPLTPPPAPPDAKA